MRESHEEIVIQDCQLPEPALGDVGSLLEEVMGETDGAALDHRGVRLRLGSQPLAYDLQELYRSQDVTPPQIELYRMFSLWLVTHHVGVLVPRGAPEVLALHYEAELRNQRVQTLDLQPRTQIERAQLGAAKFGFGADGEATVAPRVPLAGGIKIGLGARLDVEGEHDFTKSTPTVTAIGTGSTRCEWYFQRTTEPLVGDQSMFQLVLAPRRPAPLTAWLRAGVTTRGRWPGFSVTRYTDWIEAPIRMLPEARV